MRKNVNNQGIKGEIDEMTLNLMEIPEDIEFEKFPKEGHEDLLKESMDIDTEFATLDDTTLGSDSNPEIEHLSEASKHSFRHEVPESAKVQGNKSSGLGKVAVTDDPASDASEE